MWRPLKIALYLLGSACLIYYIYDLAYPGHFVGDMYGYEVVFRIMILASVILVTLIGIMFLSFYWRDRQKTKFRLTGHAVISISVILMVVLAVNTFFSRSEDRQRDEFYKKDIAELVQIARTTKNPLAIDVIMSKNDTTAVELLGGILLDRNEAMSLRYRTVQALAYFGTARSREILAAAGQSSTDEYLTSMISQALETIDQAGANFVPDRNRGGANLSNATPR